MNKTDFSSATLTAKLYFNHAPVQNAIDIPFLPNIPENAPSKAVSVATLLKGASATDQDKNPLGLALTVADGGGAGTWQYELAGGVWHMADPWQRTGSRTRSAVLQGPFFRFVGEHDPV